MTTGSLQEELCSYKSWSAVFYKSDYMIGPLNFLFTILITLYWFLGESSFRSSFKLECSSSELSFIFLSISLSMLPTWIRFSFSRCTYCSLLTFLRCCFYRWSCCCLRASYYSSLSCWMTLLRLCSSLSNWAFLSFSSLLICTKEIFSKAVLAPARL